MTHDRLYIDDEEWLAAVKLRRCAALLMLTCVLAGVCAFVSLAAGLWAPMAAFAWCASCCGAVADVLWRAAGS